MQAPVASLVTPEPRPSTSVWDKPRLSPAEVESFRRYGYLKYAHPVFPDDKFRALAAHFDTILAETPEHVRPEDLDVPHIADVKLFEWLLDDAVLDLVEPIIGPDICLFSSHFICKPPERGRRVPWHTDAHYWRGGMNPVDVCTVWLAIDPSTRVNGAMKVVSRSNHRTDPVEYEAVDIQQNVFNTEIKPHQINPEDVVLLELEPNQASLHHSGTMHGSDANTSPLRRCGYTMRYMSTRVRFNHEERGDWHQIYLARGRDHAGNRYGDPSHAYTDIQARRAGRARRGH